MAYTDPYVPDVQELLQKAVQHHFYAVAYPEGGESFELDVESMSVTFSDSWSPHIQASATCRVPDTQGKLDALDARKGCRIKLYAGYIYTGRGEDVQLLGDLSLRERSVKRPQNQIELSMTSAEIRAHDYKKFTAATDMPGGVIEFVEQVNLYFMRPETLPIISDLGPDYGDYYLKGLQFEPGQSGWDILQEIMVRTGTWIYVDGNRNWRIDKRVNSLEAPLEFQYFWEGTAHNSVSVYEGPDGFRRNLIHNPSFESNLNGWNKVNITANRDATYSRDGSYSLNILPSGQPDDQRISTNWFNVDSNTGYILSWEALMTYYRGSNIMIEIELNNGEFFAIAHMLEETDPENTWLRKSLQIDTFSATQARVHIWAHRLDSSGFNAYTAQGFIDNMLFEVGSQVRDFFHGGMPDTLDPDYVDPGDAMSLVVGENGTLIDSDTTLTRDEWFNCVAIENTVYDPPRIGTAQIKTGVFGTDNIGYKTYYESKDIYSPFGNIAASVAAEILAKKSAMGRGFMLTATAAYWLRPGMPVTVKLPTGPAERHIVQQVTFNPQMGSMKVETRLPENVTIETE